jgi:hypothetical protein
VRLDELDERLTYAQLFYFLEVIREITDWVELLETMMNLLLT